MRQRAIGQFGLVPDFNNVDTSLLGPDFQQDVTPETLGLAQQNTAAGLSTAARITQAHQDAIRQIKNALAARGALRSGEAGFQLGREQQNFTQGTYDANQKLLDYLAGVAQAYAEAERQRQNQQTQGLQTAYTNAVNQYAGTGAVQDGGTPSYNAPDINPSLISAAPTNTYGTGAGLTIPNLNVPGNPRKVVTDAYGRRAV